MYSVLGSSIMLYSVCLAVSLFVCLPVCVRDSSVSELHVLCLSVSVLQQYSSVANKVYPSPTLRGGGGGGGVAVGVAKGRRKVTVAPDINTQEQSSAGE